MGRRRIRKRRTNSKSMHAVEPTAKRRKQNRVSIKNGCSHPFFSFAFSIYTAVPKKWTKIWKNSPDGKAFGNNYAHLRRRYGYEEKRKVWKPKNGAQNGMQTELQTRQLSRIGSFKASKDCKFICLYTWKSTFLDYVQYASNEKRIFRRAFLTGLLRGFGTAVGVTVLGAVIIYAFQVLAKSNLPYIADFISDIIDIIEKTRK